MASFQIKTRITNLQKQGRTLRWAGARGLFIGAEQSIVVDGGYPTACRNSSSVESMQADIDAGIVSITLLTNIPVEALPEAPALQERVRIPAEAAKAPERPPVQPLSAKEGYKKPAKGHNERFVRADSEESKPMLPKTVTLPGHDPVELSLVDKSIFRDAPSVFPQAGVTNAATEAADAEAAVTADSPDATGDVLLAAAAADEDTGADTETNAAPSRRRRRRQGTAE